MTEKIYLSPIASKTVDTKLQYIMEVLDIELDENEELDIRDLTERNDLNLETTEDAPYA